MIHEPVTVLDDVHEELLRGDPMLAMDNLFRGLRELREHMSPDDWQSFSTTTALEHPVRDLIHQDPMVRRSFEKPRGYSGDAVLLDLIYRFHEPRDLTPIGAAVYDYATQARPAALAVQNRRRVIARTLDQVAASTEAPRRVLSVACGHFREGLISRAVADGAFEEVVALDADERSLSVVSRTFPTENVRVVHQSVRRLLARMDLGEFDFASSAGLYDYLEDRVAQRLTAELFAMLRPGGKLLICNFVPQIYDAGFMETYMGWELIFRTETELMGCARDVPPAEIASFRAWTDAHDAIAYLELERAREPAAPPANWPAAL